MFIALIAKDKPGHLEVRKRHRDAHLAYLRETGCVVQAGPILDAEGEMCGSLLVLDVESLEVARDWSSADPYAGAGLFESVELIRWHKVI